MDLGIAGKVALVTGGSHGIGLGIAEALAAEGVKVAIASRNPENAARGANALAVGADLLTEEGCGRAVEETERALGPVDILINNLGTRAGSS